MVMAYWRVGKRIVEEEQSGEKRAEYGAQLIEYLSKRLSKEFGKGFSNANIWNFRLFYLTFPENTILYALRRELTWTHYRSIMRVQNPDARQYYIKEAADNNWNTRQLDRNINTLYYERLLSSKDTPTEAGQPTAEKTSPRDLIKDPYVLEFLDLPRPKEFSESELETAIISHLQEFLLEMGKGFAFVGRQYHMKTDTKHFYIDLVFYNFILKCFVLIDLKLNELTHQDIGQMDMYVRMFESLHTSDNDNPTIGIVLCTEKDQAMVKYSILEENKQIFASKYTLVLPTPEELSAEVEREIQLLKAG
jgi:predicted nuclease of restriction endonuclease-like (RecB) superfamily